MAKKDINLPMLLAGGAAILGIGIYLATRSSAPKELLLSSDLSSSAAREAIFSLVKA